MCGLAGYFNISSSHFPLDDALLDKFQDSISHRGPDGFNIWKSATHQLALVHRRLSIVDLSNAAAQPMMDRQHSVILSFNGEIYNHLALRKELEALGHHYFSNSDTENLLYAYKQWGISFLDRLEGMFAIAIFDMQKNELYLIRDRMGVKPLYFSLQGDILSFASEIKALWQLPWNTKKIKYSSMYHYLTFLTTPAPSTLFDNIYKLPAGFYMKVSADKEISFNQWYTPIKTISNTDKRQFEDEQFCIDGMFNLLDAAVKKRLMSDVPFGAFLSGGLDSSLIVALMAQYTNKVKTFNVAFSDGPELNEAQWAQKVAQQFDTDHHEIMIGEKEAFSFFDRMIHHQDEPLADCVGIPMYHVAKLAKDSGVTVVLSGEGSDELFCGYHDYARYIDLYNRIWKHTQKFIPAFAKKGIYHLSSFILSHKPNYVDVIKNWSDDKHLFWAGAVAFTEHWKEQLIKPNLDEAQDPIIQKIYQGLNLEQSSYEVVDYHLKQLKKISSEADFLTSMIYLELKTRLPELLLMRLDKMTMAASVEGRVPFLDHHLVEFAMHIPSRFKYNQGITKSILKKMATKILPHDVIYRKKMGFVSPITRWFKNEDFFKPYMQDMITNKHYQWHEHLNLQVIQQLLNNNKQTHKNYSVQLWALQNLMSYDGIKNDR